MINTIPYCLVLLRPRLLNIIQTEVTRHRIIIHRNREKAERTRITEKAERKRITEKAERKRITEKAERKRITEKAERKRMTGLSKSKLGVGQTNILVAKNEPGNIDISKRKKIGSYFILFHIIK
jgi:hypothetical protein